MKGKNIMENIQTNVVNNDNISVGSFLDDVLKKHNYEIVENEKVFSERKKADNREGWIMKRDTLLSNIQHEINIFNIEDVDKQKEYIAYWSNKNSLNKDKLLHWLDEDNTLTDKFTYCRRLVKEMYSFKSIINEENPTKKDGKHNYKRDKDEFLGYEIDLMVGQVAILGKILNTKKDGTTIYKVDKETGKKTPTWRNNTIKHPDGSPLSKEDVISLLPDLKESFEGDNYKEKFIQLDLSMKRKDAKSSKSTKSKKSSESED